MGTLKLNNADDMELLGTFKLNKEKYPIAYEAKVQELLEEGIPTRKEAEDMVDDMEFNLELYYHKGYGLFAVEAEVVECGTIYSPYNKELASNADF